MNIISLRWKSFPVKPSVSNVIIKNEKKLCLKNSSKNVRRRRLACCYFWLPCLPYRPHLPAVSPTARRRRKEKKILQSSLEFFVVFFLLNIHQWILETSQNLTGFNFLQAWLHFNRWKPRYSCIIFLDFLTLHQLNNCNVYLQKYKQKQSRSFNREIG